MSEEWLRLAQHHHHHHGRLSLTSSSSLSSSINCQRIRNPAMEMVGVLISLTREAELLEKSTLALKVSVGEWRAQLAFI